MGLGEVEQDGGGRLQSIDLKPITDIILYNTIDGVKAFCHLPHCH